MIRQTVTRLLTDNRKEVAVVMADQDVGRDRGDFAIRRRAALLNIKRIMSLDWSQRGAPSNTIARVEPRAALQVILP